MGKGKRKYKLRKVSRLKGEVKRNGSLRSPQMLEGNAQQLLPGLQNDIVLDHIVPKLPWRAFHVLSSVSLYWRDAIQSRQVHDARARFNSLETLVAMNHTHPDGKSHAISLYSLRENCWHQLPEFPFYKKRIPRSCVCAALQGSLYVLGGDPDDGRPLVPNTGREVFVLDLVGERGWKRCADLPQQRFRFACGVLNEKIYVLGGYTKFNWTNECWMYDPKEDHWSSIAPMTSKRNYHHVVAVGDELWVHGGRVGWEHEALYTEVYYPAKDEWACVQPQHFHKSERLFTAKGKPYLITSAYIYPRQESSKGKNWTEAQKFLFADYPGDSYDDYVDRYNLSNILSAQAVDKELLVLFIATPHDEDDEDDEPEVILYRSEGFGTDQEYMQLHKVKEWALMDRLWYPRLMYPIDL